MITFSRVDPSFSLVEAEPASPTDAMAMTASQYNVYQLYPKAQEQRFKKKKQLVCFPRRFAASFPVFWAGFFASFREALQFDCKNEGEGGRGPSRGKTRSRDCQWRGGGGGGVNQKVEPSTLEALVEGLRRRVGKDKDSILGIISCFFSRQEFRPRILITHLTLVVGAGGCQGYRSCERETNRL